MIENLFNGIEELLTKYWLYILVGFTLLFALCVALAFTSFRVVI